jgi:hypothetical protein
VATLHDFNAAWRGKHDPRPLVRAHLSHIVAAAESAFDLARRQPRDESTATDLDAIGALVADWAAQLALLVDGNQRLAAQYVRRLAELLREHAKTADPLRIEALAWAILCAVEDVGEPPTDGLA